MTIGDIAERAGVSKGAVSYALNQRPGISDETRERILKIAEELGWYPNRAARSLSVARADACGFVLARPPRTLAVEAFFAEFLAGVESELASRSLALTLQLATDVESEIEVYRRWWGERRVDGVLVMDVRVDDPRIAALAQLGLPAVIVGGPVGAGALPCVWHDERAAVEEVVRYLAALGHRRVARVEGVSGFLHSVMRSSSFLEITAELGLEGTIVPTDYSPASGARATRRLLSEPSPPTAIAYDSDALAATGLGVAQQMGFVVPDDLSIVAWDDSLLCQVVHPPLTTLTRDIASYGALACRHLLTAIDLGGHGVRDIEAPRAELTTRGSTGPAPAENRSPR
ncbi:MAG: LacI family DNA-binding transcriptional regulator [Gaiellales bacterium]